MKREGRIFSELLVLHRRCWFNIGFAARLAGRWSNEHFIAIVLKFRLDKNR